MSDDLTASETCVNYLFLALCGDILALGLLLPVSLSWDVSAISAALLGLEASLGLRFYLWLMMVDFLFFSVSFSVGRHGF